MNEHTRATISIAAAASFRADAGEDIALAHGRYHIECRGADGALKWQDDFSNLLTTQGRNYILDTILGGSAYTAAWYVQPFTAGTPNAADTYASQTTGAITQATNFTARPTITFTAAASGTKASNATALSFTGTATITGLMLVSGGSGVTTPGNVAATGGVLLSEGTISPTRSVISGDQLTVSYSLTV